MILTSPESVADVLNRRAYDFEKPGFARRHLQRYFAGGGIVAEEGTEHKEQKRLIMPAFQQHHINRLKLFISCKADQLIQCFKNDAVVNNTSESARGKTTVEIIPWAARIALDVSGMFALGHDFGTLLGENKDFLHAWEVIEKGSTITQIMRHGYAPAWFNQLFPSALDKELNAALEYARDTVSSIVNQRFLQYKENENQPSNFLEQMITSGEFTREECVSQVLFALAAA